MSKAHDDEYIEFLGDTPRSEYHSVILASGETVVEIDNVREIERDLNGAVDLLLNNKRDLNTAITLLMEHSKKGNAAVSEFMLKMGNRRK